MILTIAKPINITINKARVIHNGDNTHHHDQSIHLVSFNTINAIVRMPEKPMPPELLDCCDMIVFFNLVYKPLCSVMFAYRS